MDDKRSTDRQVQQLLQRVDRLEQELKQLQRARQPRETKEPHGPLLCETNASFTAGEDVEVEILVFDEDDDELSLSGETFDARDVFLDEADTTTIEEGTRVLVQWIDGKSCITQVFQPLLQVYRGISDVDIDKGDAGDASRYEAGSNTPTGIHDEIQNDYIDIAASKNLMYITLGGTKYLFAVECPPT